MSYQGKAGEVFVTRANGEIGRERRHKYYLEICQSFVTRLLETCLRNSSELLGIIKDYSIKGVTGKNWREFRHKSYGEKFDLCQSKYLAKKTGASSQQLLEQIA